MTGRTISGYRIIEKLGEGGMGVVYKAQDTKLQRPVALKFLPPHIADNPDEKARFLHEAQAASALNHPNISTIHSIEEAPEGVFIVMEYVEGKTFKRLIQDEKLSAKKILDVAIQVCEGLNAAHANEIVHRDIKSDNLMLTRDGRVKIMDFGLAKLKGATKLTKAGSTLGTAEYMSPEQATGEEVDQRSDIYSFGVVLYELLTGRVPFTGEHHAAIIYSILNEEPQPVARYNSIVSAEMERIISKSLAKGKEERYQHIDDLLADLRRERKSLEYARTSQFIPVEPTPKAGTRKLWKYLVPASVVAVLALVILILKPFKIEVAPDQKAQAGQNSLAVMYFENIPEPDDMNRTGEMLTNLLITSLSQVPGMDVISRERLYDIQQELGQIDSKEITPTLASQIAQRAGVKTMLLGSILQMQPQLAVTTRLIEVSSGKILNSQRVTGFSSAEIFSLVDSLTILVRADLEIQPPEGMDLKSVAEVTTNSPEAYRSFVEGVELTKKFYNREARAALENAIELDSNFAMAYYVLAASSGNGAHVTRAWELRHKVSERERLQIESVYALHIKGDLHQAVSIAEELVKKYPRELLAYQQLAEAQEQLGEHDKVISTFQAGLKIDSLDKFLWNSLAYAYAGMGNRTEALKAVDRYVQLAPGEPNPYDSKGEIYSVFGEIDSAQYWYKKALTFRGDFQTTHKLGNIALIRQNYPEVEKYYLRSVSASSKQEAAYSQLALTTITGHQGQLEKCRKELTELIQTYSDSEFTGIVAEANSILAFVCYGQRDYAGMVRFAQKVSDLDRKDPANVIYRRDLLAWSFQKNGNSRKAQEILSDIKKDIKGRESFDGQYLYLSAMLDFESGNYSGALEKFRNLYRRLYPNCAPNYFYAVTLYQTGQIEDAAKEFQRLTWWTPISYPPVSLNFIPFSLYWPAATVKAHYWLGVIYQEKGDKSKATAEFSKFLEIWKNADPGIPEVEDAKKRLAELKSEV
ncbi:MAG: protein kinase [candidate division Zixibacteria bacterium]|nr:protein kinase [candidate division Zixibacteria bacterium]